MLGSKNLLNYLHRNSENWNQLPIHYILLATLLALLGYSFLLCFPMLFVVSVYKASQLLSFYPLYANLWETLFWITLSIFFGHVSVNILTIDFATIPGLKIQRKSAGRLFHLLDEIKAHYSQPSIQQFIITEHYELRIVKVAHFGIPLFTHNTLAIGLPLLLTLSPTQFKCLLTREMIRYSKKRHKITNWLSQLSEAWERYHIVLMQRSCIGYQMLYGFFTLYCPVFRAVSLPARLSDELLADRNTLDMINSDELLSAFQAKLIAQIYFEQRFQWEVAQMPGVPRPFSRLQQVAKTALSQSNSDVWLNHHLNAENTSQYYPTLRQRMENLGLTSVKLPPKLSQSAAEYFFQQQLMKIIHMSDNNWVEKRRRTDTATRTPGAVKDLLNRPVKKAANNHKQSAA